MRTTTHFAAIALLAGSLGVICAPAHSSTTQDPSLAIGGDVDALARDSLQALGIRSGLSVAVYTRDGRYVAAFGNADVEAHVPATTDTSFYIASATKSFTAMALNIVHHRGDIDLDLPLAKLAPSAGFPETVHPERVTLRHLLTHTSGIANDPIMFRSAFSGDHSPALLWSLLADSVPNERAPLGTFEYTNTGYNIATILTDRLLDVRWQDLLARELFVPLGMTRASTSISEAERLGWTLARPCMSLPGGGTTRIEPAKTDMTMQSAGGVILSANDALRWLEFLVENGRIRDRKVMAAELVRETRAPLADVNQKFGPYTRDDYGLGWYIGRYGDDVLVHHFGSFAGFRSHISYMPERHVAVAVFMNDQVAGNFLPDALANYIYDRLAGKRSGEDARAAVVKESVADFARIDRMIAAGRAQRARRPWTLSLPKSAYAGSYASPLLGDLVISAEGDRLLARIGVLRSYLEPFTSPDTARVEWVPLSGDVIRFEVDGSGEVAAALTEGARLERQH